MTARRFPHQFLAQLHHLRQVQVVPFHSAVALRDPLKARVEPAADVDHHSVGAAGQKIAHALVKVSAPA